MLAQANKIYDCIKEVSKASSSRTAEIKKKLKNRSFTYDYIYIYVL